MKAVAAVLNQPAGSFSVETIDVAEPREGDIEYGVYVGMFPTNRRIGPPNDDRDGEVRS